MFERFSNSWELVKASWSVLRSDKELIIFPIVSFIGVVLVTITFMFPMALTGIFDALAGGDGRSVAGVLGVIIGFLYYLVMYTIIIFSNAALVGAAMIRLDGGDPTLQDGFRIASQHFGSIVGYAAISATVGMILRALQERGGIIGSIVSWIGGMAWNIATFLVIPVLVIEGIGPVEAIQRSASLLKRTWGEQIIGNMGIGLVFFLLTLGVIIVVGVPLFAIAAGTQSVLMIILAVGVFVLLLVGIGLLSSTLSGIYIAAVYRYAHTGEASSYFSQAMVEGAFKPKRR